MSAEQTPAERQAHVDRLVSTKTLEELVDLEARLTGSIAVAPPGEHYGRLFKGLILAKDAIKQKQALQNKT